MSNVGEINLDRWSVPGAMKDYIGQPLQPPEIVIFDLLAKDYLGGAILDLGVGYGRTTPALIAISPNYVGIDYSSVLVEACKDLYPDVSFRHGDARDLSEFSDESQDVIVFSYNGLDYMDHQDRLRAMAEIRRILRPGGAFVFSSHNRNSLITGPFAPENLDLSINPVILAVRLVRAVTRYTRHRRMRELEIEETDYAIKNDCADNFSLLTYYICSERQKAQLGVLGYENVRTFAIDGRELDGDDDGAWIYYLVRK